MHAGLIATVHHGVEQHLSECVDRILRLLDALNALEADGLDGEFTQQLVERFAQAVNQVAFDHFLKLQVGIAGTEAPDPHTDAGVKLGRIFTK